MSIETFIIRADERHVRQPSSK